MPRRLACSTAYNDAGVKPSNLALEALPSTAMYTGRQPSNLVLEIICTRRRLACSTAYNDAGVKPSNLVLATLPLRSLYVQTTCLLDSYNDAGVKPPNLVFATLPSTAIQSCPCNLALNSYVCWKAAIIPCP